MKIPRLTNGVCCYTLEQWALRMGFSQLFTFVILAVLFFYLSAVVENTEELATQTIFLVLGIIFLIPAIFGLILIIGLKGKITKLLLVWLIYSCIGNICYIVLILAGSIFCIVSVNVGQGILYLVLGSIITGNLLYSTLVVRSLYLNYKEENASNSAEIGQPY